MIWTLPMRIGFLVAPAILVPAGRQVTVRIPLEPGEAEEVVVATFDQDRVPIAKVKEWMLLHENGYYSTPAIGSYPECKTSDVPKLENDIQKTTQMVESLNPDKYPPELSEVVAYLKETQSFWLWQAEQELEFLKN